MTTVSNQNNEQAPVACEENPVGFGEQLRRAREEQGISVGDMCALMHISVDLWRALEEENASRFHEPVYVRGHIRTACRILKLDPKPLLDDYVRRFNGDVVKVNEVAAPNAFKEVDYVVQPSPSRWKIVLLILLVLVAVVGIWGVYSGTVAQWIASENSEAKKVDQHISETVTTTQPMRQAKEALDAPLPPVLPPGMSVARTEKAKEVLQNQTTQKKVVESKVDTTPAQARVAQATTEQVSEKPVYQEPTHYKMVFHATGPCWVQVIDPTGKSLLAREMKAGRNRRMTVPVGAKITIGNSPAMLVRLDGHPYDISTTVRRGVARFVVR